MQIFKPETVDKSDVECQLTQMHQHSESLSSFNLQSEKSEDDDLEVQLTQRAVNSTLKSLQSRVPTQPAIINSKRRQKPKNMSELGFIQAKKSQIKFELRRLEQAEKVVSPLRNKLQSKFGTILKVTQEQIDREQHTQVNRDLLRELADLSQASRFKLLGEIESAIAAAKGPVFSDCNIKDVQKRITITNEKIGKIRKLKERDLRLFEPSLFSDFLTQNTEQDAVEAISALRDAQLHRDHMSSLIMKGAGKLPSDSNLCSTTEARFDQKIAQKVKLITNGNAAQESLVCINQKQLRNLRKTQASTIEAYVENNLFNASQRREAEAARDLVREGVSMSTQERVQNRRVTLKNSPVDLQKLQTLRAERQESFGFQSPSPTRFMTLDDIAHGFSKFDRMIEREIKELEESSYFLLNQTQNSLLFNKNQGNKLSESKPHDANFQYLRVCQQDTNLGLPVLDRIVGNTLALWSYSLSEGHCRALKKSFSKLNGKITRVMFDNCGISDEEFAQVLKGIQKLDFFESIVFKQNSIDEKAVAELLKILQRGKPNHLKELRIVDCKIKQEVSRAIVEEIFNKCTIERLALVHANLHDTAFATMTKLVEEACDLKLLDLAWCERNYEDFIPFYSALSGNTCLRSLNLSWNSLFDQKKGLEGDLSQDADSCLTDFCSFLTKNKELVHLDVSNSQLQTEMLKRIVQALSNSSSLMSIHLCGNPGLTPDFTSFCQAVLSCGAPSPVFQIQALPEPGENLKPDQMHEMLALKQILQMKKTNECVLSIPILQKHQFVLQRKLGFESLIPGSQKWRICTDEKDQCWVCDQHIPSIIFWSSRIAEMQTSTVPSNQRDHFISRSAPFANASEVPSVQGSYTGWQPLEMRELSKVCFELVGAEEPDYISKLKKAQKCRDECVTEADLNQEELKFLNRMKRDFRREYTREWPQVLMDAMLPYKRPQFINGEHLRQLIKTGEIDVLDEDVFVCFAFIRAGRQYTVVRQGESAWVQKDLVRSRDEEVRRL